MLWYVMFGLLGILFLPRGPWYPLFNSRARLDTLVPACFGARGGLMVNWSRHFSPSCPPL